MDVEEQVTSLELSKSLKELGISQKSLFYWVTTALNEEFYLVSPESFDVLNTTLPMSVYVDSGAEGDGWHVREVYPAFTVAELGELLPFAVSSEKKVGIPGLGWRATLEIPTKVIHTEEAKTEADARARMLVYLHKQKGEKQ